MPRVASFPATWGCLENLEDWKNLHWLSERLGALRLIGTQLRAPLEPLNAIVLCDGPNWFQGALNWTLMMPKYASLSDSCTSDRYAFSVMMYYDASSINRNIVYTVRVYCFIGCYVYIFIGCYIYNWTKVMMKKLVIITEIATVPKSS